MEKNNKETDMKTFEVVLPDMSRVTIKGSIIIVKDDGQMIIYNQNEPTYRNIEAIIPPTALVYQVVESKI